MSLLADSNEATEDAPASFDVNNVSYGLDTHAALSNQKSILDSAFDVITKGIPLTGLAVVNAFANTAIDIGNFFGGETKRFSIEAEMNENGWDDYANYYKAHEQGIEAAAFAAGSLIPGLTAIKALKLLQGGAPTSILTRATNLFAGPKRQIINDAVQELEAGNAALYPALNVDKFKAIALGLGDQTLQALVYETATAATMKASPLIDQDSLGDTLENMFFGALVGGGIGGVIEGIGVRSIFNKAVFNADINTKANELATYLGKGGYTAGDRTMALVSSIDAMPEPTNLLGRLKASATKTAAELNAKKILSTLTDGDNELTNTFFDTLMTMKTKGGMEKEELYNYLARLAKITRIGEEPSVPSGTIFYVNRFATDAIEGKGWDQLVTKAPHEDAEFSLGYKLREYSTETRVASASDKFVYGDSTVPMYANAKEAFEAGHDIFINKDLRISVNPNAPNLERVARPGESRPLTRKEEIAYRKTGQLPEGSKQPILGAPIVLDLKSGAISTKATAVVGDYGVPKIFDKGLQFGDKSSLQSVSSAITKDTDTIDANARYVWASKRGVQQGDTIALNDGAMLEQLYREASSYKQGFAAYMERMEGKGISIDGLDKLPGTPDELLNHIRNSKDELIQDLIKSDAKLSSQEVAIRANVPEEYLENGLKASKSEEYMIDPAQHSTVNHVQLEYDLNNILQQDGQIMRGMIDWNYRKQIIEDALRSATVKHFGEDAPKFISDAKAEDANILGVGPKAFSFSNARYGSVGQKMERIGKFVTDWQTKQMAKVSQVFSSAVMGIRNDPEAAFELAAFRKVRLATGQQYRFLPEELATKYGMSSDTAVLSEALVKDRSGKIVDWKKDYVPDGFFSGDQSAQGTVGSYTYYKLGPKVAAFERANLQINNTRLVARNNWYASQGLNRSVELDNLYTPAIDTNKYPHFALVRAKEGTGLTDDAVSIITAENAQELEKKIASLRDEFSVYTKSDLKKYHEVLGDYQYNRNFAESQVDTALKRKGILNNIYPDANAETTIKDYIDWHSRQEIRLTRDYVEIGNAQLFAELRAMGERFTSAETSKTGFVAGLLGRTTPNPYNAYIKTALAVSEKDEYRIWHEANEKIEAFFSSGFRQVKEAFLAAKKDILPWEKVQEIGERFGLGNPYGAANNALKTYMDMAGKLPPERYLTKFISTANAVLGSTAIRLDAFQSLINTISTPVMLLAEANSTRQEVSKLVTMELPDGSGKQIPAVSKLVYNAVANFFDPEVRKTWMPIYKDNGIVRDKISDFYTMIDHLTLPFGKSFDESKLVANLKAATDLGAKLTLSNHSEEFARFIAADTGRQIFEAAGHSGKDLTDNISTFVNRVHGNYVASQRPIAFQGPIGQAIGLFQTYQFNLLQQLFRYVEEGQGKTLALMAGMQTTLFGLQGLPGFQAINNHIIGNAANNPAHKDIYSVTPNFMDKKLGDYLLYGTLSNWMNTGLYSRGDINPRQITILPVNPLDYPAIAGGIKLIGALYDTSMKIAQGGNIPSSLLLGIEHNGLSRPLSGLAQLSQGFATTSKGDLVATTRGSLGDNGLGLSELATAANFSRLAGARPLDEAIAMDAMYRSTLYTAKDNARIGELGQAVKSNLYLGRQLDDSQVQKFAVQYASSGGRIEHFGRKIVEWTQDANASVANKVFRTLQNPLNQEMMKIMGGIPLPDYYSLGSTAPSGTTP